MYTWKKNTLDNQVGKAQNELQDWNEILPEDQDFKRMRELIENE